MAVLPVVVFMFIVCSPSLSVSALLSEAAESNHSAHEDMLQLVYKNNPRVYYRNWRKYSRQLEQVNTPSLNGLTEVEELSIESEMEDPVWDRTTLFKYDKPAIGMEYYLGAKKYNLL